MEVEAGKEGMKFEAGPFSFYGMMALTASPGKKLVQHEEHCMIENKLSVFSPRSRSRQRSLGSTSFPVKIIYRTYTYIY